MTLHEKQTKFAQAVADLLKQADVLGFGVTLGECYRSPQEAERLSITGAGIKRSLHTDRLAIDLNLFRGETYLRDTVDYEPLGEWWEAYQPGLSKWGGRFTRADGGHFSFTHEGRS